MKKRFFKIVIGILLLSMPFVNGASAFYSVQKTITGNFLSAGSLEFSLEDVTNNPLVSTFFSISNMQPGDPRTQTVRVQKDGSADYKYGVSFVKTKGDDALCNALQIEAKFEGTAKYSGSLSSLSISPAVANTGSQDDWDFIVNLNDASDSLKNKTCEFDLVFKGWQTNSDGSWGFSDTHSLVNSVSTGTWALPGLVSLAEINANLPGEPEIELNLSFDLKTLSFKVINIKDFRKLSYEVTYDTELSQQGIIGSSVLDNQDKYVKDNIILGTCSSGGKCVYAKEIKNIKLMVTLEDEGGNKVVLEKKVL